MTISGAVRAALLALFVANCGVVAEASAISPFTPEVLLAMTQVGGSLPSKAAISPDGRSVAYTQAEPLDGAGSAMLDPLGPGRKSVWIAGVQSAVPMRISGADADAWNPVWSPDGTKIAFYTGSEAAPQLAMWNVKTASLASTEIAVAPPLATFGSTTSALWSSDGKHVVVPQLATPATPSVATVVPSPAASPAHAVFQSTPPPAQGAAAGTIISPSLYRTVPALNLVVLDVASGRRHMLPTHAPLTALTLSPDGTRAMYLIDRGEVNDDVNSREIFDLAVVDLRTGAVRLAARNIVTNYHAYSFSWSHDGTKIAFIGGVMPTDMDVTTAEYGSSFPGHCYVLDLASPGVPRVIGTGLFAREQSPLLWSTGDATLYAADQEQTSIVAISLTTNIARTAVKLAGGRFVVAPHLISIAGSHQYVQAIAADGERRLFDVDLNRGTLDLRLHAYQSMSGITFDRTGSAAAYVGQDPRRPPDIWIAEKRLADRHQLTTLNPQIDPRSLGEGKSVSWMTPNGKHLNGALLLPAGYEPGKRYPMITWIYAGEPEGTNSRTAFGFALSTQAPYFNLQLLASRGYAVFVPDSVLHVGTPMRDIADDVLPGVDNIVEMGVADPTRLGVYGQSYGGYSTLSLLVQSDRFKAAVAMSGISDIFAMYGAMYDDGSDWTSWAETQQGRMGGTPWNQRQRYIDNSPFFFLDRVHTPVLLEYGQTDRFAAINWEQAFVSLRRLGRTATLVRYANEGHVLLQRANQLDFCTRMIAWFNEHLSPRA